MCDGTANSRKCFIIPIMVAVKNMRGSCFLVFTIEFVIGLYNINSSDDDNNNNNNNNKNNNNNNNNNNNDNNNNNNDTTWVK